MFQAPTVPARSAAKAVRSSEATLTKWADFTIALMLATLGVVSAARTMHLMVEIPGDTIEATVPAAHTVPGHSMAEVPPPPSR